MTPNFQDNVFFPHQLFSKKVDTAKLLIVNTDMCKNAIEMWLVNEPSLSVVKWWSVDNVFTKCEKIERTKNRNKTVHAEFMWNK